MNKQERWNEIIGNFSGKTILVIGDVMLDEYIWGEVERISPEAPVPVVQVTKDSWVPGGAANVANNISSLGGRAIIAGVVGDDLAGSKLKKLLRAGKIDTRGILLDKERPTVTKSRVLAGHQQVLRIDREDTTPMRKADITRILQTVRKLAGEADGIILEDYAKGLISQKLVDEVIKIARQNKLFVVVDPNGKNTLTYRGARIVTPNRKEAQATAGLGRKPELGDLGRALLKEWGSESVLITLGEDGMCLVEARKKPYYISTVAREVFDVSGAGDTVVGTVALALAAGADLQEASHLANCAAGVVVGKLGTATADREEVVSALGWR